ncbi:hypothetical protein J4E83_009752 [Alternaria metachromatica]|uniref:uncharacterized protein n=1 Tax=Alternaria metachromatica TaxID=283354 RepID=UPI0020C28295|nr:uncharacterized protein J4E83_009752 [Alternaria metachromatica]KAI4606997.1 hypothetical protein J4E83_009752 [Alternaria metachromatica]
MSDTAADPPPPPPEQAEQGSPRGAMDPPATPGPDAGLHAKVPTATTPVPAPSPAPSTPGRRNRPLLPNTPRSSSSPFPTRAPRTPGALSAIQPCTVDETLFSRVTVHTAKCTECDQRNMDTMRRCPGCTFQVCQPCYEKRVKNNKGLLHGNMATPGAAGVGAGTTPAGRTVRRRPVASSTPVRESEEKKEDEVKAEEGEVVSAPKETTASAQKSSAKKRSIRKKPVVLDSEVDELSSEDDFEPDDHSPTPSKKRKTELTFAESALATATRTPPATRATRRSTTAPTYQDPPSPHSDPVDGSVRSGGRSNGYLGGDYKGDPDLYDAAIGPYDEPLLSRQNPVLSNPASRIPEIIKRGGVPRPQGETYKYIQKHLREKMGLEQTGETTGEETVASLAEQSVSNGYRAVIDDDKADTTKNEADHAANECTVGAFVEQMATKYLNADTMDGDDNKALFNAMESAALVWGKKTFKKLDPEKQRMVQPGLKLRLDFIDEKFREELAKLMDERAGSMLAELGVSDEKPATGPPDLLFKAV